MNPDIRVIFKSWYEAGSGESLWAYLVRNNPWIFSHHPSNNCFKEHVWTFRGLHFCKGCVVTVVGWVLAVTVQLSTCWLQNLSVGWVAAIFVALLLPAVCTSLFGAPRLIKHSARLLLGFLMASAIFFLVMTDDWLARGVVVGVYFIMKIPLDRYRRRQNERLLVAACNHEKFNHKGRPVRGSNKRHAA
jgi:hypothetical protein